MASVDMSKGRVIKNTFVVMVGQIIARLLDLWAILLIARSVGEAAFGQFSFAVAYVGYFAIFIDLGFNITFVRELVKNQARARDLLAGMLVFKVILVSLGIGLAALLILIPDYSMDIKQLVWIMTFALLISPKFPSVRLVYEQVFQARLRMEIPMLLKILDGVLLVILIYSMIYYSQPMYGIMLAYVLSNIPGLVLILWASRRVLRPSSHIDWHLMIGLLKQALPVALLGLFASIYSRFDILLLSIWSTDSAIGYYSSAYRLTEALRLLPGAVLTSLYPMMVDAAEQTKAVFVSVLNNGLKPLLILLIPICVGTSFLATPLIDLFYTPRYEPAGDALAILIWAEFFFVTSGILSYALIAKNRQNIVIGFNGIMLLVNILLNVQLIPRWDYIGSSIARGVTESIGMIGFGLVIYRMTGWAFWKLIYPLLPGISAMAIWLYFVPTLPLPIIIISSAVIYVIFLFITGGTTWQEVVTLKQALIRSKPKSQ